ncbi:fimbrial protein [Mesorhizobium sp. CAU 1741]|uniref:fimbrial protein n=1 Tax=Mesorhizobium sp. CAU 1741 TaxID=3140366 RepID=UPI00325B132A
MAAPHDDDEDEKPLDPAVENVRRKLVRFIVINLGILFIALMAVVVALVYRATQVGEERSGPVSELPVPENGMIEADIVLPRGARVVGHSLSGGIVSLHVELGGGGQEIHLYDMSDGQQVGRFTLREAQ